MSGQPVSPGRGARALPAAVGLGLLLLAAPAAALSPSAIYKKCGGAVVLLLGSDDGKQGSGGTGSIISADGRVLTNAHVVLSGGRPYRTLVAFLKPAQVTGDNAVDLQRRFRARVVAFSPPEALDLALLQLEAPPAALPTLAFADPEHVDVGDEVVAIGHPEQGGLWTLTTGAISTVIANYGRVAGKDVFQTEASVNRGNSGGPLLDGDGNMVGINTMIARQGADGVAITAVNFSLKSSVAVRWLAGQGTPLAYAPPGAAVQMLAAGGGVAVAPTSGAAAPPPGAGPQGAAGTAPRGAASPAPPSAAGARVAASPAPPASPASPASQAPPAVDGPARPPPAGAAGPLPPGAAVVLQPLPTQPLVPVRPDVSAPTRVRGRQGAGAGAGPTFVTPRRPYALDALRAQQMRELEDMLRQMRPGASPRGDGLGLW